MKRLVWSLVLAISVVGVVASPVFAGADRQKAPSVRITTLVPSEFINGHIGDPFGSVMFIGSKGPKNLTTVLGVHDLVDLNADLTVYLFVDTFSQLQAINLGTMHVNGQGRGFFFARTALVPGTHSLIVSLTLPGCDGNSTCTVLVTPGHFGQTLSLTLP